MFLGVSLNGYPLTDKNIDCIPESVSEPVFVMQSIDSLRGEIEAIEFENFSLGYDDDNYVNIGHLYKILEVFEKRFAALQRQGRI